MRKLIIAATAVLLVLAGCSNGGDEKPGTGAAKAPAEGWPQPENGQITEKMCGLLTADDYAEFGHQLLLPLEPNSSTKASSNGVYCSAPTADILTLSLQPTAESAKVYYQGALAGRKSQVISDKLDTILVENLAPSADESFLDYWVSSKNTDELKEYALELRRGSLVLTLVLSMVDDTKETDAKGTLVALADRVLQRVGDLGKTDTGVTPMLRLEAGVKGKAGQLQYSVPDRKVVTLKDVKLPWKLDLPLADHGDQQQNLMLNVHSPIAAGIPSAVSCRLLVDDKVIDENRSVGYAGCLGNIPKA